MDTFVIKWNYMRYTSYIGSNVIITMQDSHPSEEHHSFLNKSYDYFPD